MADYKVIIVEDDVQISEIQNRFVSKIEGFEVVGIANTISESEDLIDIMKPDVVLLDVKFPDGNGIDLLWRIRQTYNNIDVIFITAAKEVSVLQDALRGGAVDYILKPMTFGRLSDSLNNYKLRMGKLVGLTDIEQKDIDLVFHPVTKGKKTIARLPKGVDQLTLNKIIQVILNMDSQGVSAENLGVGLGISRSTARRYLEFLVSSGVVKPTLEYGTVGRPERIYLKL